VTHAITPGTLPESDARLLRTPYDRARIGLPCESGRLNATNRHLLDLSQISDRVEVPITRASEQHLPPAERSGIYPTEAHQEYIRRATAETDRLPVYVAPYNRRLPLHASLVRKAWRPLSDWRFCAAASFGLSLAAIAGYRGDLPVIATLALLGAVALCWRMRAAR
jgi:hypothetical protein